MLIQLTDTDGDICLVQVESITYAMTEARRLNHNKTVKVTVVGLGLPDMAIRVKETPQEIFDILVAVYEQDEGEYEAEEE